MNHLFKWLHVVNHATLLASGYALMNLLARPGGGFISDK